MPRYEYRVVPAPNRGVKARGVKGAEARFSYALQELMNQMGHNGWEYQRAETLPSIERSGLTSTTTEWRNVLVFRRAITTDLDAFQPELLPAPNSRPEPAIADGPPAQVSADAAQSEAETPEADEPVGDIAKEAAMTAAPTPEEADAKAPSDGAADTGDDDDGEGQHPGARDASRSVGATQMLRDNGVEDISDVSGMTNSLRRLVATRKPKPPSS